MGCHSFCLITTALSSVKLLIGMSPKFIIDFLFHQALEQWIWSSCGSSYTWKWASCIAQLVKYPPAMQDSWVRKIPWRRDRLPAPVFLGFPSGSAGKESTCNAGDLGLIPGLGRSPGGGNGNPLLCSCLENSMGRGAWWATVHGVTKSWTRLSN